MSTILDRLQSARPGDATLRELFTDPQAARADMLRRAAAAAPAPRRRRRRVAALAVASLGTVVTAPMLVGPAQADLSAVAQSAAEQPGVVLEPGQWLRTSSRSDQQNGLLDGDARDDRYINERIGWMSWRGEFIAEDTRVRGRVSLSRFRVPREPGYETPTPAFIASLPTSPTKLREHLDATVSGSNSHEEAVYVALTGLLRSGLLPSERLGAVLTVLDSLPGTSAEEVQQDGRDVVRLTYSHWFAMPAVWREQILLDPETGRVVGEHESWPGGGTYDLVILDERIVDSLPGRVREAVAEQG